MKSWRFPVLLAIVGLGFAQLGANCTDGVTPDCSKDNVCAPSTDSGFQAEAAASEASLPETGGGNTDASDASDLDASDAAADAPVDG